MGTELETGAENDIFWSDIGTGLGEPGGTPSPRIPRSTPLPRGGQEQGVLIMSS